MKNDALFSDMVAGRQTDSKFGALEFKLAPIFIFRSLINFTAIILCGLMLCIQSACCQTLDSFNPNVSEIFGDGNVTAVAFQPDGKILFGGSFGLVGGLNRSCIARVNSDGSLDPNFNPGSVGAVGALAVQADGKIIVGGDFTSIGGQSHTNLARLNPDGSADSSFNADANNTVFAIAPQPDGRILVGGAFTNLSGQSCMRIGRLNTDGSLDTNFNANASKVIIAITLQTNGSIVVGGNFTNLNGSPIKCIGRLNTDGSLDTNFNPQASSTVSTIVVQPDNMILVSGSFTNIAGVARNRIARLNTDGSVDASFNSVVSNAVYSIALQANGKMLVAGALASLNGNYIGRLNTNGTLDATFNPVASNSVYVTALQKDGKVVVGGAFTNLAGSQRNAIGRLNNNDAATETISNTASSITWMRGDSSPEVWRVTFEMSTDGVGWTYLGDGSRIAGGWQLTGVSIPGNASLRMTGISSESGNLASSSSLIQSFWGAPFIVTQPLSQTIVLKSNASISVVARGATNLSYQWQQNGTNLINGGKISGATNATLSVTSFANTNAGLYSVAISNSYGAITSQVVLVSAVSAVTNDTFNPGLGTIYSTVFQSDNKVILGGSFSRTIGGLFYAGIGRASPDGSLDSSFRPYQITVYSSLEQLDGKVVLGGSFQAVGGQLHPNLGRLNSDGTFDSSFSATANGPVYAMLAQPDGKLLVAGSFTSLGNQPHSNIGRINADGSIETNFIVGASNTIYCVALQTNGQIIIGGSFTNVNGSVHNHIARLNPDGSLDPDFTPSIDRYYVSDNPVYCLAIQSDGKILLGGSFFLAEGLIKPWLMRLNSDGTLDTAFNATPNNAVYSLALQADGKIFVGGTFTLINGITQNYLARLSSDGTLDSTYVASASLTVNSTAIQRDGRLLVGGGFGTLFDSKTSYSRSGIGRFSNTEGETHSLTFDGPTITWLRGGTGPELAWAIFDSSNDGINWSVLGSGIRIAGGWQLTGISTTTTNCIRARGYVPCGEYNGSGWYVQDALLSTVASNNPPAILVNDNSLGFATRTTNGFGFNIAALTGQAVVVEASTNLLNWSPAFTNTVSSSPFYFFDPTPLPLGSKFYRARLSSP
jgi:uncharacterized delta-60 repeat protein